MNQTNHCIACTVSNCSHHAKGQNYCTLPEIHVGCSASKATSCSATECDSFAPCKDGSCC